MKVIIFTETKVGEGHYQAAKALQESLLSLSDSTIEVQIVSGLRCIHPCLEWITVKSYFLMLKRCPSLWKQLYTKVKRSSLLQRKVFAYKIKSLIEAESPDIIICTHPTCIQALGYIKQQKYSFKLGVICTDYDFHPFSISSDVDAYFVAHPNLKSRLIEQYQIEPDKIYSYGIPLRPEYEQSKGAWHSEEISKEEVELPNREERREHLKHITAQSLGSQKKNLLLTGGSTGYGSMMEILISLEGLEHLFNVTVITGKNGSLYKKIKKQKSKRGWDIEIVGYEQDMKSRLEHADLLITKPGGLTVSEAIACSTPFVMINPIPGHEEANAAYLEEHGIGYFVPRVRALPAKICSLMSDQRSWREWQIRLKDHHQANASINIARLLLYS